MSLHALDEYGAHFVLCRAEAETLPNGQVRPVKSPLHGHWESKPPTLEEAAAHEARGGLVGIVPGPAAVAVVDVDSRVVDGEEVAATPGTPITESEVAAITDGAAPLAAVKTIKGLHLLYARPGDGLGNSKWNARGFAGEIRCDKGYCIIWNTQLWADAVTEVNSGDGALHHPFPVEILRKPSAAPPETHAPQPPPGEDRVRTKDVLRWAEPLLARLRDCGEGGRNNQLNQTAYGVARKVAAHPGADGPGLRQLVWEAAESCGLGEDEIGPSLDSGWEAGFGSPLPLKEQPRDRHGQDEKEPPPPGVANRPRFPFNARGLRDALKEIVCRYRFNIRAMWPEYNLGGDKGWEKSSDRLTSNLRQVMASKLANAAGKNAYWMGKDKFYDTMDALLYHAEVDPVLVWLSKMPEWDGTGRIDHLLTDLFNVPLTDITKWASRYLLIGVIQRAEKPSAKIDEFPILIGSQGCGKSTFAKELLPEDERGIWFTDRLDLSARPKEQVEAFQGCAVVEIADMAGGNKASIERLKAFLTADSDSGVRLAYRRDKEFLPRRFVFFGTANPDRPIPNDPTGNRRFVPVIVHDPDMSVEDFMRSHRDQYWAEALVRYKAGERANLPRELFADQSVAVERQRVVDEALESEIAALEPCGAPGKSAVEIMREIGLCGKSEIPKPSEQRRITIVLRHRRWEEGARWYHEDGKRKKTRTWKTGAVWEDWHRRLDAQNPYETGEDPEA